MNPFDDHDLNQILRSAVKAGQADTFKTLYEAERDARIKAEKRVEFLEQQIKIISIQIDMLKKKYDGQPFADGLPEIKD